MEKSARRRDMGQKQDAVNQRRAKLLVERVFEKWASFIAYNPWKVVIITVIIQVILGLVLLTRSLDNDIEHLYTPRNTPTDKTIRKLRTFYPDESGTSFSPLRTLLKPMYADVIISKPEGLEGGESLTDGDIAAVLDVVSNVGFPTRYYQADLSMVCARYGDRCVVSASDNVNKDLLESYHLKIDWNKMIKRRSGYVVPSDIVEPKVLKLVGSANNTDNISETMEANRSDENNTSSRANLTDTTNTITTEPYANSTQSSNNILEPDDSPSDSSNSISEPDSRSKNVVRNIGEPVKIRFYLRQDTKAYYEDSDLWQHAFIRAMKKWDNENITVVYSHSGSFLQEVGNDTYPDIRIFSLAVAIFITYCGFLISGGDCVSKRMNIGRMAIIVVPLAVLGCWGFLSGIGMTFTNIAGMMPLFVVFHEVNMALMLLSAVSNNMDEKIGSERVVKAVKEVAMQSLIMMLAHTVPFVFTVLSKYLAIETFGIYTVATLLFNFIVHFTFFVGCLAIHENRIDASRHSCCCHEVPSRDDPEVEGRSCCFRCCCSGRKPTSRDQVESFLERLPRKMFSRVLLLGPVQCVLVLLTLGCIGASIWKTMDLRIDTIQETDVTTRSYFHDFFQSDIEHFERRDVFTFAVSTKEMVFSRKDNADKVLDAYDKIKHLSVFNDNMSSFWLADFHKPGQTYKSEYEFITKLKEFLLANKKYAKDIFISDESNMIEEFRFYTIADGLKTSEEAIIAKDMIGDFVDDAFDDLEDEYDVKVRIHAPSLWLTDYYKRPLYELSVFAGIQIGVLFILLMFFGNSVLAFIHVLFWYLSMSFGIFAILALLDVTINIVSIINLMIGFCYCTEVIMYSVIYCMYSEGTSNASRVYNVIQKVTPVLYNSTFGTLVGLSIMLLEKSYVFLTVFKVLGISVAVAWIHSFALIPPVLAVVGFGSSGFFRSKIEMTFKPNMPGDGKPNISIENDILPKTASDENSAIVPVVNGFDNKAYTKDEGDATKL